MRFLCGNRIAPDGTPLPAASHLGLYCLPMSHKRDAKLKWVKMIRLVDFVFYAPVNSSGPIYIEPLFKYRQKYQRFTLRKHAHSIYRDFLSCKKGKFSEEKN